jgi:thioredoxin reductase (NADPH)
MLDVIIIGAGPAGLSAARWCDELGLDTLVLEQSQELGGQLLLVQTPIKNYLGAGVSGGREMRDLFVEQTKDCDFDLWTKVEIAGVDLKAKRVTLRSGEVLPTIAIIIATGLRPRKLGIPGEDEFIGRGMIDFLADPATAAGRDVCVIGGGDSAAQHALIYAEVCPTVTLVHRGKKLRARREFTEKLHTNHCITVFSESVVHRIIGRDRVEAVEIERAGAIKPFQMAVQGVIVRVGFTPNTELFRDQINKDNRGYLVVNANQETNIENVFAVGDVANPLAPTISGAVGAGATAAKVIASRLKT